MPDEVLGGLIGAVVGGMLGGLASLVLWRFERKARREDAEEQGRKIAALWNRQNEALEKIADATKALAELGGGQTALERAHAEGAQLSARLQEAARGHHRLVVENLGPGGAQLRTIEAIGDQHVLIEPDAGLPAELLPSESHTVIAALSFGTRLPLEVLVRWIDGRGEQERVQALMPS